MTQTNPEQWAVDLWEVAFQTACTDRPHDHNAAALAIQAAFAEREATGSTPVSYALGCIANPDWSSMTADDARQLAQRTLAALKDRTHG